MTEKLYPERKRCTKCRKALKTPVLGKYCSYECAGMRLNDDVETSPRSCKTMREGTWVFKKRYPSLQQVPEALRNDPSISLYWCFNM